MLPLRPVVQPLPPSYIALNNPLCAMLTGVLPVYLLAKVGWEHTYPIFIILRDNARTEIYDKPFRKLIFPGYILNLPGNAASMRYTETPIGHYL